MLEINENIILKGNAYEIFPDDEVFPNALKEIPDAPKKLYVIGNLEALQQGLAIVGARKATPYGMSVTKHFATIAAKQNIVIISGGAYGCDSASHRAALSENKKTVVFLGGGCNHIYPVKNKSMYQEIINKGGAIVSESDWNKPPLQHSFIRRNRLIAGLSKATLIVEAGLPSGTFSTADFAIKYNREVLAVPGAITNENSTGCNKLIYEGAIPIINDEVFYNVLYMLFPNINYDDCKYAAKAFRSKPHKVGLSSNPIVDALLAQPMSIEELFEIAQKKSKDKDPTTWLSEKLIDAESSGRVAKYANGLYGPVFRSNQIS